MRSVVVNMTDLLYRATESLARNAGVPLDDFIASTLIERIAAVGTGHEICPLTEINKLSRNKFVDYANPTRSTYIVMLSDSLYLDVETLSKTFGISIELFIAVALAEKSVKMKSAAQNRMQR